MSLAADPLDEALDAMAAVGPDLTNGMSNHAPMAIEALCALGRGDAVARWLDGYRASFAPRPPRAQAVREDDWRRALRDGRRMTDWFDFFERALADATWTEVVDRWAARLAPGISASAMHGVIRTGHAVRALARAETPPRRRELADGLAYWAAEYQALPTDDAPAGVPRRPMDAISHVPSVPAADRRFTGTIVASIDRLADFPPFAPAIGLADLEGDPVRTVSELSEAFARAYLANAHDQLGTIVFVHGVTGTVAVRSLLGCVSAATTRTLLRYAWQAGCALVAAFGGAPVPRGTIEPPRESAETLVDMAIATGDEHAIKFTEACLREHGTHPSPAYLAAAHHAIGMLAG